MQILESFDTASWLQQHQQLLQQLAQGQPLPTPKEPSSPTAQQQQQQQSGVEPGVLPLHSLDPAESEMEAAKLWAEGKTAGGGGCHGAGELSVGVGAGNLNLWI